jgi:hypothetical protein
MTISISAPMENSMVSEYVLFQKLIALKRRFIPAAPQASRFGFCFCYHYTQYFLNQTGVQDRREWVAAQRLSRRIGVGYVRSDATGGRMTPQSLMRVRSHLSQMKVKREFSISPLYFTSKSPPGAPSLAFRDLKPNKKSVNFESHLNPITYLPAHKQNRIERWPSPRPDEKLD